MILGISCLIFAALVLVYIIHGFQTNSSGLFDCCFGETKSDDGLILSNANLPIKFPLKHQLK